MEKRKILIVSHNPINQFDNMGKTIGNIFSGFKKEELCQLYFRKQNTNAENCNEFFCIDDVSMCKSIFNRRYKTGMPVKNNTTIIQTNKAEADVFEYGRKRNGLIYTLRDLLWKIGKWNSKDFKIWIENQNITSIFLVAGDYIFPFNITMRLAKKYNIPLYIYFVDEFYRTNIGKQTILAKIHKFMYRKKFKKAIENSKEYFCISESMEKYYSETFTKKGNVLMNTTTITKQSEKKNNKNDRLIISYIGNLGYNRWENLIDIADVIEENGLNEKIEFNIYSGEKNENIITKLKSIKGLNYKGRINPEEVINKIEESDLLLHIENFEKMNIEKVKYSISTKIPDSLASGKVLLVYGPEEVEAINYIKRNNAGIVVNRKDDLINIFKEILSDKINKQIILKNATNLVEKNHRNKNIYDKLNKSLI